MADFKQIKNEMINKNVVAIVIIKKEKYYARKENDLSSTYIIYGIQNNESTNG